MKAISMIRCLSTSTVSHVKKLQLPPGPKIEDVPSHPAYDPERLHLFWEELSKQYGSVFQIQNIADSPMYFLSDVKDIYKMFSVTENNPIRPFFESYTLVRENNENNFFEKGKYGLICQHGEEWRRVRTKVQMHTNKPQVINTYITKMDDIGKDFTERMSNLRNENNELPNDFQKELNKWALESVALVALNIRIGGFEGSEESRKLTEAADLIISNIAKCDYGEKSWRHTPNAAFNNLKENHDFFIRFTESKVNKCYEHLQLMKPEGSKVLNIMESLLITPGLSRKDVIVFMMDMVMAAVDTTAQSMAFTLYCLATNPEKQRELQQEIDCVLRDSKDSLTSSLMANIHFTKSVLKETLRMYPTAPVTFRQTLEDTEFNGFVIPKDAQVTLLLQPMGKDENNFTRPGEFIPHRWIRAHSFAENWQHNKLAYLPFGYGTRSCIARRLAEYEIYSLIIRLFQKYDLKWKQGNLNPKSHIQLYPDLPMNFIMTERKTEDHSL